MSAQVVIDSLEFARQGRTLRGTIAIADLARLQDVLHTNDGLLEYTVSGGINGQSKSVLHITITGVLQLQCQRCFGPLVYPLHLTSHFELVEHKLGFGDLAEEDESVDLIEADTQLDVLALLEDEIILSLPISPLHQPAECKATQYLDQAESSEQNAFSVLASLKKQSNI